MLIKRTIAISRPKPSVYPVPLSKKEQVTRIWQSLSERLAFLVRQDTLSIQEANWILDLKSQFEQPISELSYSKKAGIYYLASPFLVALFSVLLSDHVKNIPSDLSMVVQVLAKMPQYLMSDQVTFPDPREGASDLYLMSLMLGLFTPIFLGLSLYSYKKSSRAATEIENLKSLTIRANELLSKFPENYYDSNSFNDSAPNIIGAPDPTLLTPLNDHNTVIFEIGNGLGSEESDQYHYLNVTHMDYDRITRLKAFLDALSPVRPGIENTSDNSDSRGNTARPNTPTSERTPLASSAKRSKTKGKAAPSKAAPTNNPFQADSLRFLKEGPEKTEIRRVRWWQAGSVAIYISIPMDDWERAFQDKASEADGIHSLNKGPVRAGAQYPGLKYVDGVWELKTLGKSGKYRTLVGRSSNARTVAGIRVFDVTLHYEKQASRILH